VKQDVNAVSMTSLIAPLALIQFIVAIFYGLYVFTPVNEGSAMNPVAPLWFKAMKDLYFVLILVFFLVLIRASRFAIPSQVALFLVGPIILTLLAIVVSVSKLSPDAEHIGVVKNYGLYYFGAGVMMTALRMVGLDLHGLNIIRACMSLSTVIGLSLYLLPDESHWTWTHQGRMIATIGNPNTFAYLCVLNVAILHGFLCWKGRLTHLQIPELGLSYVGLLASRSIAGIIAALLSMIILYGLMISFGAVKDPQARGGLAFLKWELLAVVGIVGMFSAIMLSPFSSLLPIDLKEKYLAVFDSSQSRSTSISARTSSFVEYANEVSNSLVPAVVGSLQNRKYVKYDSSFVGLARNYGLLVLFAWFVYYLTPVVLCCHSRDHGAVWYRRQGLDLSLSAFVISTLVFHGWVHYATETYPTCFLLGCILGFIVWDAHRPEGAIKTIQLRVPQETVRS
jgi:hypothetical protein